MQKKIVELDFIHEVPYLIAEAQCPFCLEKAQFACMESASSPLKTLEICGHSHSTGWLRGERVMKFVAMQNG